MTVLVCILLWSLAAVVLLALAVFVTPVKLDVLVRTAPKWRVVLTARLFAGKSPTLPIHDSARARHRATRRPKTTKKTAAKGGRSGNVTVSALRMITAAPDLLAGLLRPIRISRFKIDADVGLGDPADTGQLFGLLAPLIYSRLPTPAVSIDIRPDFVAARASGELAAEVTFIPAAFIAPGVRFAWHVFGARS